MSTDKPPQPGADVSVVLNPLQVRQTWQDPTEIQALAKQAGGRSGVQGGERVETDQLSNTRATVIIGTPRTGMSESYYDIFKPKAAVHTDEQ